MRKHTNAVARAGFLAGALLALGCGESVAPERSRLGTPDLAVVADQKNGTLGANGTAILKGFNPTNPHRGAAIIASFFWLGSSNIITSVSDHLTDGTPVGNAYALVDYVTAGGISMATYVATNVQNFPDPNPDQNTVLVVQANLSSSITDGGVMLSAYGGVQVGSALGAHRSAAGSGSSPTTASVGAITVNPGALVYGVTMSNAVVGIEPPPGFTNVTNISDDRLEADGEYAVLAGGGSVDPQWTWFFNAPGTWLATVLALNPAGAGPGNQPPTAAFTSSCSELACTFNNTSSDPDGTIAGSQWNFGDGTTATAQNPSHVYASAGTYTVSLTVTDDQGASSTVSRSVTVTATAPNQPPFVDAGPNQTVLTGLLYTLRATFSDPNDTGPWSYRIEWGDGSTSTGSTSGQGTISAGHTYVTILPRSFTIRITVTDAQGASASDTKVVSVVLL